MRYAECPGIHATPLWGVALQIESHPKAAKSWRRVYTL
jgi:hypothetical protein